jgi:hypothetical protein
LYILAKSSRYVVILSNHAISNPLNIKQVISSIIDELGWRDLRSRVHSGLPFAEGQWKIGIQGEVEGVFAEGLHVGTHLKLGELLGYREGV